MKKVLIALAVLLVLGVGAAVGVYLHYDAAVNAFETTSFGDATAHTVVIPKGSDAVSVGKFLAREKVISDAETWHLWLRWKKLAPKLKAGEYEFTGALTPPQVVDKIVKGEVKLHHFTVVEGSRCDEAMDAIANAEDSLNLDADTLQKLCTDKSFAHKLGIKGDRLEGYLFPTTYSFPKGVTEEQVITKMVEDAKAEYARANASRAGDVKLTETEVMTLASIIEKESGIPEERPRISCVFHNRLKKHDKLRTDPTVLYGMFVKTGKFDVSLAKHGWVAARTDENAYNTYVIPALPVGPIANPGAAAIEAAVKPLTPCSSYFFVASGKGGHIFSDTEAEHEIAVKKYVATISGQ
jgi:UPF0755 protein